MEPLSLISLLISGALLILCIILVLLLKSPGLQPDALTVRYLIGCGSAATIFEILYFFGFYYEYGIFFKYFACIILLIFSYFYIRFVSTYTDRSKTRYERISQFIVVLLSFVLIVNFLFIESSDFWEGFKEINALFFHPSAGWLFYLIGFIILLNLFHVLIFIFKARHNTRVKIRVLLIFNSLLLIFTLISDNLTPYLGHKYNFSFTFSLGFIIIIMIKFIWHHLNSLQEELQNRATELVNKRQELEILKIKTDDANRTKDEFLANISHELRTPLTTIIGFSELLKKYFSQSLPKQHLGHLDRISRSGRQLQQVINDLLNYALLEKGEYEISIGLIDMESLRNFICQSIEPLISEKPIEFNLEFVNTSNLYSDEKSIKHILIQLLTNASKFTRKGHIKVKLECQKEIFIIVVEDTGIGIRPEDQSLIFERFRQIDSSYVKTYQGTGIGLSIIQKIVSLLQGTIRVESEPLVGTRFIIYLPNIPANTEDEKETVFQTQN